MKETVDGRFVHGLAHECAAALGFTMGRLSTPVVDGAAGRPGWCLRLDMRGVATASHNTVNGVTWSGRFNRGAGSWFGACRSDHATSAGVVSCAIKLYIGFRFAHGVFLPSNTTL